MLELLESLRSEVATLKEKGLYKSEREITSPQGAQIQSGGQTVINLCANNYLGLSNHPTLVKEAKEAVDRWGFGLSSVRFICGTQSIHRNLEKRLSAFLGTEDTILYGSCFDANGGIFEALLSEKDAVISDALNHASIIDGIRLCKAARYRYANNDMVDLEKKLKEASGARFRLVVTDGVFSMDGTLANLPVIRELADKYDALVMVDDSHAVGFCGENGRGTPEHFGMHGKFEILTGTMGKALGGASGGYVSAKKEIVEWLRQRSRPYLFSNSLAPMIAATSLKAIDMAEKDTSLRTKLWENATYFREKIAGLGFTIVPGIHPIVPVMLGDARLAQKMSEELLKLGIYVVGFSFPVVPEGKARIRTQMSAAHTPEELDKVLAAFEAIGKKLGAIS